VNSRGSRFVKLNSTALALLATVLLVSGGASAQDHKAKVPDNQARVVAHISFTELSAIDGHAEQRERQSLPICLE